MAIRSATSLRSAFGSEAQARRELRVEDSRLLVRNKIHETVLLRRRLGLGVVIGVDFWRAVFIGSAINHWLEIEVAVPRRAGGLPLQPVGVPRIPRGPRPKEYAADEVDDENDLRGHHANGANRDELVQA